MTLEKQPLVQQSVNWDNPEFIPRLPQPLKITPFVKRFRRKAPWILPKDVPPRRIAA